MNILLMLFNFLRNSVVSSIIAKVVIVFAVFLALQKFFFYVLNFFLDLVLSYVGIINPVSSTLTLSGLGAYFYYQFGLDVSVSMIISALVTRFVLNAVPFLRL